MNPANPHSSIVSASGRIDDIDDDVADEAEYVCSDDGIDQYLLRVVNLQKVYEGSGGCCGCGKSKTYHAVRGISFGIKPNELFCMLGANGAGKSTTFSMLTGVHGITSGEAFVDGLCVGEDMDAIRLRMGVCPQHDILWPELTAAEHLELMAAVKGMKHSLIRDEVQRRLDGVHLGSVANVVAGSFSGGMRRRLSVAVSLIGDPKVIYLDEPSTGLDPVSRRALWTMFQEAKRGRAMLLTTHSMEEADALGDRVTILAKGRMRSIGTSLHLKQKYGAGYRLAFTMPELAEKPAIQNFMRNSLPMATVVYDVGSVIVFQIPRELSPRLADFFRALENQQEFPRAEYSVSITTLEEVFFEISEMARLEEARAKVGAEEKKR
jgi:ABC-type multidrug transport system ATPase subunit